MPETPSSNGYESLIWERRWFQITLAVLVLAVTAGVIAPPILSIIYKLRGVLVPVVLAIGLAYVFNPVVTYLHTQRNISRATSSGLIIVLFAFAVLMLTLLIVPPVLYQGANLFNNLRTHIPKLLIKEADRQADIGGNDAHGQHLDPGQGSAPEGSAPEGSDPEGSDPEGSDPDDQHADPDNPRGTTTDGVADAEIDADADAQVIKEVVRAVVENALAEPSTPPQTDPDAQAPTQPGRDKNDSDTPDGESDGSQPAAQPGGGSPGDEPAAGPAATARDVGTTDAADATKTDAEPAGERSAETGIRELLREAFSSDPGDREQFLRSMADTVKNVEPGTLAAGLMNSLDVGTDLVGSAIGLIGYLVIAVLITCFAFYFFSWKFHGVLAWWVPFIPEAHRERTLDILGKMNKCTTAFIRGRLIQSFAMGLILSVGWAITGVPYWLLLGVAGGLLNLIPFAGFFVWPVAIALTWLDHLSGGSGFSLWAVLIWPSVVYGIAQGLDGWVIEPLVQGQATNLNPLAVFLAVMAGGSLAGLLGMLLAIPAAACIKILLDEVVLPELRRMASAKQQSGEHQTHDATDSG